MGHVRSFLPACTQVSDFRKHFVGSVTSRWQWRIAFMMGGPVLLADDTSQPLTTVAKKTILPKIYHLTFFGPKEGRKLSCQVPQLTWKSSTKSRGWGTWLEIVSQKWQYLMRLKSKKTYYNGQGWLCGNLNVKKNIFSGFLGQIFSGKSTSETTPEGHQSLLSHGTNLLSW